MGQNAVRVTGLARWLALLVVATLLPACKPAAEEKEASAAGPDAAWERLESAGVLSEFPAEWRTNRPSPEAVEKFRNEQRDRAATASDLAREFYTRYPNDPRAADARRLEFDMLGIAVQLGKTDAREKLEQLEQQRLNDPSLDVEERYELRVRAAQRAAMSKEAEGDVAVMAEFERQLRQLLKDFPGQKQTWEMLLGLAGNLEDDKARALVTEIAASDADEDVQAQAKAMLKRFDLQGKPLAMKFTALDGRAVDLAQLKDKVVLVDFWATWCGPCVREVPKVKGAYAKFHPRGFEIVGISFDRDRAALEKFIATQQMPWPQYFDGKGWENEFGREYAIHSIPTMWLVDKRGLVRDLNARVDLEAKVEKLLAE